MMKVYRGQSPCWCLTHTKRTVIELLSVTSVSSKKKNHTKTSCGGTVSELMVDPHLEDVNVESGYRNTKTSAPEYLRKSKHLNMRQGVHHAKKRIYCM